MVDQIAVVTFTTPASPGTVDVTSPNITEAFSAALLFWHASTSDNSDEEHLLSGIGCCVNSAQASDVNRSTSTHGNNAAINAPNYNTRANYPDSGASALILALSSNRASDTLVGVYSTAIPGGVRLNFTTTTVQVKVTAVLFAGLAGVATGFYGGVGASGTETVGASPFFEPDLLVHFGGKAGSVNAPADDAFAALGFTVNDGSETQRSASVRWERTTEPSNTDGRVDSTHGVNIIAGGASASGYLTTTAFSSTGFTWSRTGAGSAVNSAYLALKFTGNISLAAIVAPISGSAGVQQFTGMGFSPSLVLGMSTLIAAEDTDTDGATAASCGVFVAGNSAGRAMTIHGQNGLSGTAISFNCHNRAEDTALLTYSNSGAIAQRATWAGAIYDGFSLDFSSAAAGYLVCLGLSLGNTPPVGLLEPSSAPALGRHPSRRQIVSSRSPRQVIPWLPDVLKARRSALARLRGPREIMSPMEILGLPTDDVTAGRVFSPGLVRGRVQPWPPGEMDGRVFSPGVSRARIRGPGVATPDTA